MRVTLMAAGRNYATESTITYFEHMSIATSFPHFENEKKF